MGIIFAEEIGFSPSAEISTSAIVLDDKAIDLSSNTLEINLPNLNPNSLLLHTNAKTRYWEKKVKIGSPIPNLYMQKYTSQVTSILMVSIAATSLGYSPLVIAGQNFRDVPNHDRQIALVANKSTCQKTLGMVKSQLGLVKLVKINRITAASGKYPRSRSMVADLTIVNNNPRSEQLINSSSKLLTASQKIAKNCANVGMVQFYIDQTDNGVVYGLINGRMKQFTCNNETPIKWGEIMCH